ncbi:hypothetical protein K438DRAFT_1769140 [Mycena galopus ATCC 62051]|nr:hypothetical protein K438DRAFT_1769140 [Mycena galopus ATCC 62051]
MTTPFNIDDALELAFLETAEPTEADNEANSPLRHQLITSPLVTRSALQHHGADFPSRGLLGTSTSTSPNDRVYVNTNTPSSVVICGVQGSGKSYTVSCLLECALIPDPRVGSLPEPLSALVFHFDEQDTGRPCEGAFLASPANHLNRVTLPQVTVLCSPSNVTRRRRAYASLTQVRVEPLYLSEMDLSAERMLAIMGCDNLETMPLYMHTALMIIREMGVDAFSYTEFKRRISAERLNGTQRAMIELRLHLLDAFLRPGARNIESYFTAGGLVLVDLTDPFLDGPTAAVLFDIVLGTFTAWQTTCGKLVVLDEAHKYLTNSDSARLTQSVSNTIRLQRHLATRVVIATQEPTVIPATILDLASTIICHRFSSPAWCSHLARHVSAGSDSAGWFKDVMALPTGHALVFSPASVITADEQGDVCVLGRNHMKLRVRPRLTLDGGASILAVGHRLPNVQTSSQIAAPMSLPTPPAYEAQLPPQPIAATVPSVVTVMPLSPPLASSSVTAPLSLPTASAQRQVPRRLKPLIDWLLPKSPVKLAGAVSALSSAGKNDATYFGMSQKERRTHMLGEAVKIGVIELLNMKKKQRQASGEPKMIRLLHRGPFVYV